MSIVDGYHHEEVIAKLTARAERAEAECLRLKLEVIALRNTSERAEAACAQMRAEMERAAKELCSGVAKYDEEGRSLNKAALALDYLVAGARTDVGAGYVSPERHAEVVRERDDMGLLLAASPEETRCARRGA